MEPKRPYPLVTAADLRPDGNVFNLLRLILASAVIWSHSYTLLGIREADPSLALLPFPISRLAVLLFFTLSGFLVVPGLLKRGSQSFAVARALRLLPGLWVMLIVTSVIILIGFSDVPPQDNRGWWSYVLRNGFVQSGGYFIDGAFSAHAEPNLVNGSLWTISREVQCYFALALIGSLGWLRKRGMLLGLWLVGIAVHMALPKDLIPFLTELRWLSISFFAGVLISLWQDRLPISAAAACLGLAAALTLSALVPGSGFDELAVALASAYALIAFGVRAPATLKKLSGRLPDYSYGIYIYAFPAQQVAIATGFGVTAASNMSLGFALALPLAVASWHLIEKPALARKAALIGRPQAATDGAGKPAPLNPAAAAPKSRV
jgi:peptidoglycan/LPS O-acetylase OafA/YrhL